MTWDVKSVVKSKSTTTTTTTTAAAAAAEKKGGVRMFHQTTENITHCDYEWIERFLDFLIGVLFEVKKIIKKVLYQPFLLKRAQICFANVQEQKKKPLCSSFQHV